MSKNYDNWERLVVAVVRREKDRQFAYAQSSNDSSSINSASTLDLNSLNSTARFDEDDDDDVGVGMLNNYNNVWEKLARVVLHREGEMQIAQTSPLLERIEYSDLQSLHHSDWNTMLLPHQRQLVWRSASLIFFSNTRARTGKNCFLVGSKNIQHSYDQPWEFKSDTKSRFPEVLEFYYLEGHDVDIGYSIKTRMLSPETLYSAYLIASFPGDYSGVPFAVFSTLQMFPKNESENQYRTVRFEPGNGRSDGWMEVELGDFYVYRGEEDREVQVQLMSKMHKGVEGLIIEGVVFRPSKANGLLSKFNQFDDDDDDDDHDDRPSPPTQRAMNYGSWKRLAAITQFSNQSSDYLLERDFKDLTLDHSKWKTLLPHDQNELVLKSASLRFFVDERTGENCFLLGAANLVISLGNSYQHLCACNFQSFSRFSEIAVLNESRDLNIRGRIKTKMLSPKTFYTVHLVFALTENYQGLLAADSVTRVFHDESDYDSKKQEQMVLFESCHGIAEGWTKVELGYFYVYPGHDGEVVEVQLQFRNDQMESPDSMKGLIIEGIEFRPANRKGSISSKSSDVNNQGSTSTNQINNNGQSVVSRKRSQLPMDYDELKLDYQDWKTMLPPDTRELVWRSSSMSFFLDERTGKNCFLLGATTLTTSWGNDIQKNWETKFHPRSRFSEVVELNGSQSLCIEGGIKIEMLCPDSFYAAYLVFGLSETHAGLHSAVVRSFYVESGNEGERIVDLQQGEGRADGWMEIELGCFHVGRTGEMIRVQLLETSDCLKTGLIVEGMEFRPLMETRGKERTSSRLLRLLMGE